MDMVSGRIYEIPVERIKTENGITVFKGVPLYDARGPDCGKDGNQGAKGRSITELSEWKEYPMNSIPTKNARSLVRALSGAFALVFGIMSLHAAEKAGAGGG